VEGSFLERKILIGISNFSIRTAIDSFSETDPGQSMKRRVIIVCLWYFTTLTGAVFLPNISLAIHYLGALAASFIFVFPGSIMI